MTTNSQFIAATGSEIMYFRLNGINIKHYNSNANNSISTLVENPTPLWLKAGDFIQFNSNTNTAANYSCNYYISIVEFNLTP
jgi:hypothetical protein